jgi:Leucine-rich repeat (LRR) protein
LTLKKNKIEELPTNIGLLRNLRKLILDENNLKSLPSDVRNYSTIILLIRVYKFIFLDW